MCSRSGRKAKRTTVWLTAVMVASGCSSGGSSSEPAATTSTAVTTTTTSAATSTTTTPVGATISRSTALAANRCIESWASARFSYDTFGTVDRDELGELAELCDDAQNELEVDLIGVPTGSGLPARELSYLLSLISFSESSASLQATLGGDCDPLGICELEEGLMGPILSIGQSGDDLPASFGPFLEGPFVGLTLDDLAGLVVDG